MPVRSLPALAFAMLAASAMPILAAVDDVPCDRNHYILAGGDIKLATTWLVATPLSTPRTGHTATLLADGRVLVAGGWTTNRDGTAGATVASAEIFDPASGAWTPTGQMLAARRGHAAIRLNTGKVLVVGGADDPMVAGSVTPTAELFDPDSGTWSATGSLREPRDDFTATLLDDGRVLVAGGVDNWDNTLASTEIYDPASGTWTPGALLQVGRFLHTATKLGDGTVLMSGGWIDDTSQWTTATAERYDPAANVSSLVYPLALARVFHAATALEDGRVIVSGGYRSDPPGGFGRYVPQSFGESEIFDPVTGTWTTVASLAEARYLHQSLLLSDGSVLVVGGYDVATRMPAVGVERYDPAADAWAPAGTLPTGITGFTLTLLGSGKVLVVGGSGGYSDEGPTAVDTVMLGTPTSCRR